MAIRFATPQSCNTISAENTWVVDRAISLSFTLDGSCYRNGQPNAQGGWAVVVRVDGLPVAEARRALCACCDQGKQTSIVAELRAAQFALNVIHELLKLGHPLGEEPMKLPFMRDFRAIGRMWRDVNVRVRSDSTYVLNGLLGFNKHHVHKHVWRETDSVFSCLKNVLGSNLQMEKVAAHSGDTDNERADELAKKTARVFKQEPAQWMCLLCNAIGERDEGLAVHLKEVHLGRNMFVEDEVTKDSMCGEDGLFRCDQAACKYKSFRTYAALLQHYSAKHDNDEDNETEDGM